MHCVGRFRQEVGQTNFFFARRDKMLLWPSQENYLDLDSELRVGSRMVRY